MDETIKLALFLSILLNVVVLAFASVFVSRRGGLQYLVLQILFWSRTDSQDNNPFYRDKVSHFETLSKSDSEVIFLGDSLTDLCEWGELFKTNSIKNRGICADTTKGILNRLDNIIESKPQKLFILIGINDLNQGRQVAHILANYKLILEKLKEQIPQTQVFIQSVLPVNYQKSHRYNGVNKKIIVLNTNLKDLAEEYSFHYIDLFSSFLDRPSAKSPSPASSAPSRMARFALRKPQSSASSEPLCRPRSRARKEAWPSRPSALSASSSIICWAANFPRDRVDGRQRSRLPSPENLHYLRLMTALDIIVLLLVGGGLVAGWFKGFVGEVLSLCAWIVAIVFLKLLHAPVTAALTGPVGTGAGAAVLAFALVFGIVFLAGKLVAKQVGGGVKRSVIGPIDRVLGAGFGALKGLIGATLLYLAGNLVYDTVYGRASPRPEWMAQSRTYPLLYASGRAILGFVAWRRGAAPEPDDPAQRPPNAPAGDIA